MKLQLNEIQKESEHVLLNISVRQGFYLYREACRRPMTMQV